MVKSSLIYFQVIILNLFVAMFSLSAEEDIIFDQEDTHNKSFSELLPGEKIDFHTGEVGHYAELVSIEGNGLPIKLGHRILGRGHHRYDDLNHLTLEYPRLEIYYRGGGHYEIDEGSTGTGAVTGGVSLWY